MNSYKPMHVDNVDENFSDSSNQMIIRSSFENQTTNAEEWIDPYDSVWLRILTFLIYIVEVTAASIMITFVYYETSGYAGHYRTLINQLLSYFYGGVILLIVLLVVQVEIDSITAKLNILQKVYFN